MGNKKKGPPQKKKDAWGGPQYDKFVKELPEASKACCAEKTGQGCPDLFSKWLGMEQKTAGKNEKRMWYALKKKPAEAQQKALCATLDEGEQEMCCEAETATCRACRSGKTEAEVCANPRNKD